MPTKRNGDMHVDTCDGEEVNLIIYAIVINYINESIDIVKSNETHKVINNGKLS